MPIELQSPDLGGVLERDVRRLSDDLSRKRRRARLSRTAAFRAMTGTSPTWTRLGWAGMPSACTLVQVVAWPDPGRGLRDPGVWAVRGGPAA